jgi:hypothetical protein
LGGVCVPSRGARGVQHSLAAGLAGSARCAFLRRGCTRGCVAATKSSMFSRELHAAACWSVCHEALLVSAAVPPGCRLGSCGTTARAGRCYFVLSSIACFFGSCQGVGRHCQTSALYCTDSTFRPSCVTTLRAASSSLEHAAYHRQFFLQIPCVRLFILWPKLARCQPWGLTLVSERTKVI